MTINLSLLAMSLWLVFSAGCASHILTEQSEHTIVNDGGREGQFVVPEIDQLLTRIEVKLVGGSWSEDRGAKGRGTDVVFVVLDVETLDLLGTAILPRDEVPTNKLDWAGADFTPALRLDAGRRYLIRMLGVTTGQYGWNNYALNEGNSYPIDTMYQTYNGRDDVDHAFRLIGRYR